MQAPSEAFLTGLLGGKRKPPARRTAQGVVVDDKGNVVTAHLSKPNLVVVSTDDASMDGREVVLKASEVNNMIGSFQGKQAPMRRSSKGRAYRAPGGQRRYIRGESLLSAYSQVLSYTHTPGVSKWVARYRYLP